MASTTSEGVSSLLDTDLYKLTMQSVVFRYFKDVMTYALTNRTAQMKLNRAAFEWLKLEGLRLTAEELSFLKHKCPYFSPDFLDFLSEFKLHPAEQVTLSFTPDADTGADSDTGALSLTTTGLWVETILYEIPLLALISEAYFKFVDTDWNHDNQQERAKDKGLKLLEAGCVFSEFGSRRRRDHHTQKLVMQGLLAAQAEASAKGFPGKFTGTSNVHFAQQFGVDPIGTVAHEWFMGVAAVTQDYVNATELALNYWVSTFGVGVLGIALTDTFGTPVFLDAFVKPLPDGLPPAQSSSHRHYADAFTGTRQDSGDPLEFVKTMRAFYDREDISDKKTIVFSDSLNVERCIEYKRAAEDAGFITSFGVGTFFTNDYNHLSEPEKKSAPMNIVIKLSSANGNPAIKISDNIGKNTGDRKTVAEVKKKLGYVEHSWQEGDEKHRWDK